MTELTCGRMARGPSIPTTPHSMTAAHVILDGEMTLTSEGETRIYREGDRCDVPANAVHSARMGPQGCRYLIGECQGCEQQAQCGNLQFDSGSVIFAFRK